MAWLKKNVNVGHWLIIGTIVIGFISTNAVGNFSGSQTTKKVEAMEPKVTANVQHAGDANVHMPYAEKVKAFVPRKEFEVVQQDFHFTEQFHFFQFTPMSLEVLFKALAAIGEFHHQGG